RRADEVVRLRAVVVLAVVGVPLARADVAELRGQHVEDGVLEGADVRGRDRRAVLPHARIYLRGAVERTQAADAVLRHVERLPARRRQRVDDGTHLGEAVDDLLRVPVVPEHVDRVRV